MNMVGNVMKEKKKDTEKTFFRKTAVTQCGLENPACGNPGLHRVPPWPAWAWDSPLSKRMLWTGWRRPQGQVIRDPAASSGNVLLNGSQLSCNHLSILGCWAGRKPELKWGEAAHEKWQATLGHPSCSHEGHPCASSTTGHSCHWLWAHEQTPSECLRLSPTGVWEEIKSFSQATEFWSGLSCSNT